MRFHCPEISSIILLYAIAVVAILIKQMLVSYVGCFINIAKIIRHRGNKKSSCKRVSKIFNFRSSVLKPKKYIPHFTISERSYYRFFFFYFIHLLKSFNLFSFYCGFYFMQQELENCGTPLFFVPRFSYSYQLIYPGSDTGINKLNNFNCIGLCPLLLQNTKSQKSWNTEISTL